MLDTFILYNDLCLEIEVLQEQLQLTESEREQWWMGGRLFHTVPMDNAAERFDNLTIKFEKISSLLEKKTEAKRKMEEAMRKFEGLPRKIAYMRYIQGKTLKEISLELDYSYDYVREVMSKLKKAM
ncbi:MAG: hypothetical protein ABF649_00695 [Bacillus sp. (in: firmicutes)]